MPHIIFTKFFSLLLSGFQKLHFDLITFMIGSIFTFFFSGWTWILTKKHYLCSVNERRDIIVSNTLTGIGKYEVAGYLW